MNANNQASHACPDCGYTWFHAQHGGHRCADLMKKTIAKRDARIAELESRYQRDVYGLNNECDPIGGDPAGGYANDNARLRAELAAIKAQEPVARQFQAQDGSWHPFLSEQHYQNTLADGWPIRALYAAPVSEVKAQGVVLDGSQLAGLLEQVRLNDDEAKPHGSGATYWNNAVIACQVAIRDALAAPVQQVSVPDGSRLVTTDWLKRIHRDLDACQKLIWANLRGCDPSYYEDAQERLREIDAMLAAAPAAPAADAGVNDYD